MTDPATAMLIMTAVGVGTAAYGQYQQGKTAQDTAKAQAAWNIYNAKVAKREADIERQATTEDVRQQKKRGAILLARQRALVGMSGLQMEGSPLLVAEDTAAELAKEEANIQLRGARRAMGFETQSILDVSKAGTAKARAAGFGRGAVTGAGASILAGGANLLFQRGRMRGDF